MMLPGKLLRSSSLLPRDTEGLAWVGASTCWLDAACVFSANHTFAGAGSRPQLILGILLLVVHPLKPFAQFFNAGPPPASAAAVAVHLDQ